MLKIAIILYYSIVSVQSLNLCGDWTQYKDKKCFKVLTEKVTQEEAIKKCLELNEKTSLLTIHDQEEQQFTNELLVQFNNISMNAWIGMKYNGHEYDWIDGTDSNFTNWSEEAIRNGSEPCAQMSLLNTTLGKWTHSSCKSQALILCQKKQELSLNSMKDIIEDMIKTIDKQNIETKELIETNYKQQNQINSLKDNIEEQNIRFNTKTKEFEYKINSLTEIIENQQKILKGLKIFTEPPYFEKQLYQAEIYEGQYINGYRNYIKPKINVLAKHKWCETGACTKIGYKITGGNHGGAFSLDNETGTIYVAGPLDYETRKEYELTLGAFDNFGQDQTKVKILVKDDYDMPPVFDQSLYETTIVEEDSKDLPKVILKVTAIDGDKDTYYPPEIHYVLIDHGTEYNVSALDYFKINSKSGEISVLSALDRDSPGGRPQWRFKVQAREIFDGSTDYAEVIVNVKDINDNDPFFPKSSLYANLTGNGTVGMTVMTMTATDYDDPNEGLNAKLKYSIEQNEVNVKGEPIFIIDEGTGVISTAVCCLNSETNPEYILKVGAMDGGGLKATGIAIIKIVSN